MRPFGLPSRPDPAVELFVAAGENAHRTTVLLATLLRDFPEHAELAGEIGACEQRGDEITHDTVRLLADGGSSAVDTAEGHRLATAIDDIVDDAEQAADQLVIYGVEAPMEQAVLLADALVGATEHVAAAIRAWRAGEDPMPALLEVHRYENEGDRLSRDGIASLFAGGIDPMVVIRWKDIFTSIESAIDACESVAHVLEGIAIKRGR